MKICMLKFSNSVWQLAAIAVACMCIYSMLYNFPLQRCDDDSCFVVCFFPFRSFVRSFVWRVQTGKPLLTIWWMGEWSVCVYVLCSLCGCMNTFHMHSKLHICVSLSNVHTVVLPVVHSHIMFFFMYVFRVYVCAKWLKSRSVDV